MADSFVHLHQHTEYSMLDGAARIGDAVAAAVRDGQPAMGITDHGNMYGVLDFYKACRKEGIRPIIGTEAYMAHESRAERPPRRGKVDDSGGEVEGGRKLYYHLTLLAEDNVGYKNLIQLASRAYMEGYYYKPRVDWELLEQHSEGVIATTGCLGGHVLQSLMNEGFDAALAKAARLQDIFGRDNLFVEIQDHGIPEQRRTNPHLFEIARRLRAPLLATNDSHYVAQGDAVAHDALLCVQTGALMSDPDRFKFHGDHHYLKTAEEMRHLFREVEVACDNSLWIAERCNVEIEFDNPQLPNFPLPEGFADDAAYLEHLTFEGARERWGNQLPDEVVERLAYELRVIADMGFNSYFLIVWDLIRHAREKGIRVGPGRGSAAGCAVAYTLRITDLDPIRYDLLFERFLNPSRVSMPDIDMDFDSRYRDEMIRYAAERYGRDRVAQIVTFSTIKARAAVRDAARVLGYPYAVGDKVAKAMPDLVMGRDTPLHACLEKDPKFEDGYTRAAELRQMYHEDPDARKVIDVAKGLEGLRRQDGIHAAAVVITREPLTEYLPIQRKPESGMDIEDAPVVTQYEMKGVESLGLLKMDFLGLRNLDVISDTLELIRRSQGVEVDIDRVPLDDAPTFELLGRGDTIGVFQLEGSAMRDLVRRLAPTSFDDVAALVALYRPGPMEANMHLDYADIKNGRKPVTYFHPEAEELLADTYGLMIYQESVMRVAQKFAGYSLADADNLRKACGKKDRSVMAAERSKFEDGVEHVGHGRALGMQLFDIIERFADYAFNKSHSYGYGFIAYQTAYLKANFPAEYLAALLTSVKTNLDKAAVYLAECRAMGIEVLVPDVNRSASDFTPTTTTGDDGAERRAILFGLSAVRNVGTGLVELVVAERSEGGPFADFHEFCQRVDLSVLNKKTIESLVKAGGFDSMGHPRQGLLGVYEQIIDHTVARRKEHEAGMLSLFGGGDDSGPTFDERTPVGTSEFEKKQKLAFEKEMLGLYVSDHPLLGAETLIRRRTDTTISQILEAEPSTPPATELDTAPAGNGGAGGNGAGGTGGSGGRGGSGGGGRQGGGAGREQRVRVGGVITALQRKWTRKGDLMGVFLLEDLQSSIEVMVFPKTMQAVNAQLVEDQVVILTARVDRRDEVPKLTLVELQHFEPLADETPPLRLQLPDLGLDDTLVARLKELFGDFPGESEVYIRLGSTQVLRLPDDVRVDVRGGLVGELRALLGADAVVV